MRWSDREGTRSSGRKGLEEARDCRDQGSLEELRGGRGAGMHRLGAQPTVSPSFFILRATGGHQRCILERLLKLPCGEWAPGEPGAGGGPGHPGEAYGRPGRKRLDSVLFGVRSTWLEWICKGEQGSGQGPETRSFWPAELGCNETFH